MNDIENVEIENEDFEEELDEDFDDIEDVEEPEEENSDIQETETISEKTKKNDSVPLSKYLEEKSKRKTYEKKLKEQEDSGIQAQLIEKWENQGFDRDTAIQYAGVEYNQYVIQQKLSKLEAENEIADLSKKDGFYADAVSYKKEIHKLMQAKNLNAEEAYNVLRGKQRQLELKDDTEQKELYKRRGKNTAKLSSSASINPKNPYPLDDTDKKALLGLQKSQPNASWNPEKYYKMMKGD
jgi:hypothetical protein